MATLPPMTSGEVPEVGSPAALLEIILSLASAVDARDPYTRDHSLRVADISVAIAELSGWAAPGAEALHVSGLLHDVGRIGVPDQIFSSSGRLTDEEFNLIKAHAAIGAEMADGLVTEIQTSWIRHHHERWDGRGYPEGLAGAGIPGGARILAVADSWDAMISDRPFRQGLSERAALDQITNGAGKQYDAGVVEVFIEMFENGSPLLSRDRLPETPAPLAPAGADA